MVMHGSDNSSPLKERRAVLIVATLAAFLTPFMGSAINIALPSIGQDLSLDAISLSLVASSYLLTAAMFVVPAGRYADIYGRKKVFFVGILIFTLSTFLSAVAPTGSLLILFRLVEGVGSALIYGTGIAMLTSVYAPGERGGVIGIYTTAVYIGLSAGPFIGGFLTQYFGWRILFLSTAPMGLFALLLVRMYLPHDWADARGEPYDMKGALLYSLGLFFTMAGLFSLPYLHGYLILLAGIGLIGFFVTTEMRVESPVLDIRLLAGNRVFAYSNFAALINYGATFAVGFLLSLYLQYIRGLPPSTAGLILITQPVIQAVFASSAGRLSDHINPGIVASVGMGFCAAGLFFFTDLTHDTPYYAIILVLAMLGLGFALFSSPNTNAIMNSVEKRMYGVASGMAATMRTLGMMVSMGIATMIIALFVGTVQVSGEMNEGLMESIHLSFMIFAVLCVIGVVASLQRNKIS